MKTKEIIFVPTGEVRPPKAGEYYSFLGNRLNLAVQDYTLENEIIYKKEERITEWIPSLGEIYFTPKIDYLGLASYNKFYHNTGCKDFSFVFPTSELATAQAQKWIDEAKGETK